MSPIRSPLARPRDADRLHGPGKTVDETSLDELERFSFLASCDGRKRLAKQPAAKDVAPVGRELVRYERD